MQAAREILAKIEVLHKKQAETLNAFSRSLLIKSIWPDAFADGKPVKFGGQLKMKKSPSREQAFLHAWLYGEGKFYFLSPTELKALQPHAEIHEDYYY